MRSVVFTLLDEMQMEHYNDACNCNAAEQMFNINIFLIPISYPVIIFYCICQIFIFYILNIFYISITIAHLFHLSSIIFFITLRYIKLPYSLELPWWRFINCCFIKLFLFNVGRFYVEEENTLLY